MDTLYGIPVAVANIQHLYPNRIGFQRINCLQLCFPLTLINTELAVQNTKGLPLTIQHIIDWHNFGHFLCTKIHVITNIKIAFDISNLCLLIVSAKGVQKDQEQYLLLR